MLHCTMTRLDDYTVSGFLGSDSRIAYCIGQRCVSKQPILPTVVDCMRSIIVMVLGPYLDAL